MYLVSDSFEPYGWIPPEYALGRYHPTERFTFAGNRNPHLAWGDVPAGTKSFAVLCFDPDVPSRPDDVNKEGRVVPLDLPRVTFWHWVLLDVPADVREIPAGSHSEGVTPGGKSASASPIGVPGINDYTGWFADTPGMKGNWYGYDGPAPPWNDSRIHGYCFQVLALDVATTGMHGSFDGRKATEAIRRHVLDEAKLIGLYAINPDVRRAHGQPL